jgi:monofunctional biosynthetic peptidoglycan transglycosylase
MADPDARSFVARPFKWLLVLVIGLLLLPYVLTPLYLVGQPVSTPMLWRWSTVAPVTRKWLPIATISPALILAVIVAEDARFCSHNGIDLQELREAIEAADDLAEARGGSTITQQVAKNLFLWPGRNFVRKGLELPLALWIDLVMPKRRILEIYLNIAEWGPHGEFGAEAGAQHAFGRSAKNLTPDQAARMAAVLPNPHRRNAGRPGPGLRRLAGIYAGRARAAPELDRCIGGQ